jgi:arylformamidase
MDAKPLVFGPYDQEGLDRQYNQQVWAANAAELIKRYGSESDRARETLGQPKVFAYGPTLAETLDVYCAGAGAPIHLHIHGGAWRQLSSTDTAYPAPMFVTAGVHFVAVNFGLLPEITLSDMVDQVRRAVLWTFANAARFGGDRNAIQVGGHSSGAHLAGCLVTTDWAAFGLPRDVIKSALCVSGMYDLEPVRLSARNTYVRLDLAATDAFSPIRHLQHLACPVVIGVSEFESAEFIRQSRAFAAAVDRIGRLADLIVVPGMNHFEGIETLRDKDSPLARAAIDLAFKPQSAATPPHRLDARQAVSREG